MRLDCIFVFFTFISAIFLLIKRFVAFYLSYFGDTYTNLRLKVDILCGLFCVLLRHRPRQASACCRPLPCRTQNILANNLSPFNRRLVLKILCQDSENKKHVNMVGTSIFSYCLYDIFNRSLSIFFITPSF